MAEENTAKGFKGEDITLLRHLWNQQQKEDGGILSGAEAPDNEQTHSYTQYWSKQAQSQNKLVSHNKYFQKNREMPKINT